MSSTSIYQELRTKYLSGVSIPTEYPNEEFTRPAPAAIWGRFTIIKGETVQMDIGAPIKTFRTPGILIIQLFAPLDAGSIGILNEGDSVASLFRNWCGQTIRCRAATVEEIGNDNLGWYQVNVTIPFHTDELH